MATISDTLKKIDNTAATSVAMIFRLDEAARCETDAVTSVNRVTVTTHASTGAFSTTLREGRYRVTWRIGADFSDIQIAVPAGSGTYDLNSIVVIDDEESTFRNVFDDWDELQTLTVVSNSAFVILREDDGDPPARDIMFLRTTNATALAATPDGVNLVSDASDARFVRQGVDPDDL